MADRREPEEVVGTAAEAFDRAVALFDAERFFEAHEFFEYVWKFPEVAPEDRDFWKGVTQVAVACVHTQRGNAVGACTLFDRAAAHLERYPSPHHGVDSGALADAALALSARVREDGASPQFDFPRFPRVVGG